MSFEVKYDKDRNPIMPKLEDIPQPQPAVELPAAQDSVDQMLENQGNSEPVSQENQGNDVVQEIPVAPVAKPAAQESWKTIRDRMAQAEKKAQELESALLEERSRRQSATAPEEDLNIDLDEDALAEGKHLKKVDKRFQKMEQQLKVYEQQAQLHLIKSQLKAQFPDWENVYNDENLARLQLQEPEIYHTLNASNDIYRSGVSAYKMIKQMGILAPEDTFKEDKALAQKNASKPKSLASISPQQGDSPLSKANAFANGKLTDELKAQMWKETNQFRR